MQFGYAWDGRDSLPVEYQRRALEAAGCEAARISVEAYPSRDERDEILDIMRDGDRLVVCATRYVADDVVELHYLLAHLAERGAALHVIELGQDFRGNRELAAVTEDYVDTRRQEQTKAAREKLKKLPMHMRGGRPPKQLPEAREVEFILLWAGKHNTLGFIARQFGTTIRVVKRWADERGLPEK